VLNCHSVFDWRNGDRASAHLVTNVYSPTRRQAWLHTGWDDGIVIRLGRRTVFKFTEYGRGKGFLYLHKYRFEKRVPITLEKGWSRLAVTSINSHGAWVFSLRITDSNDLPFPDLRYRLKPE